MKHAIAQVSWNVKVSSRSWDL